MAITIAAASAPEDGERPQILLHIGPQRMDGKHLTPLYNNTIALTTVPYELLLDLIVGRLSTDSGAIIPRTAFSDENLARKQINRLRCVIASVFDRDFAEAIVNRSGGGRYALMIDRKHIRIRPTIFRELKGLVRQDLLDELEAICRADDSYLSF